MTRGPIHADLTPALVVAGVATAVMCMLGLLVRQGTPDPVSTPLIDSDGRLYYIIAIASAAGIAMTAVVRCAASPPAGGARDWRQGVVPGLAALAGSLAFVFHHDLRAILVIPVGTGAAVLVSLALPHVVEAPQQRRIARDVLAVAALYALLAMVIAFRTRALYGGTVSGVAVAVTVLARIGIEINQPRVIRAAGLGLVAAELVWAFNYINMSHWMSAIAVLAVVAIGGWLVRRDEWNIRERPATRPRTSEPGPSNARPGP